MNLNLLPPEKKELIKGKRRNRRLTAIGSIFGLISLLLAVGLFGATLYMETIVAAQTRRIEQTKEDLKRFTDIEQMTISVRDRVMSLSDKEKTRLLWSKVVEDLAAATPEGVQLTQVSFSTLTIPHLQFSGQANNKEKVASLRERLEASDRFEQVSIRQVGQTQDISGRLLTTFSLDANITGVAQPKAEKKPKEVKE